MSARVVVAAERWSPGTVLGTRLLLATACTADEYVSQPGLPPAPHPEPADESWVFRRVLLYLGWRWWAEILHRLPDAQRDGLRAEAQDGLAAIDAAMFSLTHPGTNAVNRMMQAGLGLGLLMMHVDDDTTAWDASPLPILGVSGIPRLPPLGPLEATRTIPWCDGVKGSPPASSEIGPLDLAREIAWWYWQAATSRRAVCEHGSTHDRRLCPPGGTEAVRGRINVCDGCCAKHVASA